MPTYDWIVNSSSLPWLRLKINFPYESMLKKAKKVSEYYQIKSYKKGPFADKDWFGVCLHGLSFDKTFTYFHYGYNSHDDAPYDWTEISPLCPVTKNYFKTVFPYEKYFRIKFMLLKAGGKIMPHVDDDINKLSNINVALNQPDNCMMKFSEKKELVPWEPGAAFMLNLSKEHAVFNNSNTDRYHMIIEGIGNEKFKKIVEDSYELQLGG